MQKTTLYLDDKDARKLKRLSAQIPGSSSAGLIREAIRDLLRKRQKGISYRFLKRSLRRKSTRTSFGDPVLYQRTLRKEWR